MVIQVRMVWSKVLESVEGNPERVLAFDSPWLQAPEELPDVVPVSAEVGTAYETDYPNQKKKRKDERFLCS